MMYSLFLLHLNLNTKKLILFDYIKVYRYNDNYFMMKDMPIYKVSALKLRGGKRISFHGTVPYIHDLCIEM